MMKLSMGTGFAPLFKKYRLRSEIETLTEFGDLMAEEGLIYETSLFTRWQNGSRMPHDRKTLLTILKVFVTKGGIQTLPEANIFLESADQGYLTEKESISLPSLHTHIPFQAPRRIAHFTGRDEYIDLLVSILTKSCTVLLHGQPGIGKTALAINIAYTAQKYFPDGVLWYQLDSSSPMNILASIAQIFDRNITGIQDISIRSSIVRSITSTKKLLFVLDNVENIKNVEYLLPNSKSCSVLITSIHPFVSTEQIDTRFHIDSFSRDETYSLFRSILGYNFTKNQTRSIDRLYNVVQGLPLALHVTAKYVLHTNKSLDNFIEKLQKRSTTLTDFGYQNKSLHKVLASCFNKLTKAEQQALISTAVFAGKDFSLEAIAHMQSMTKQNTQNAIDVLIHFSFVEYSTEGRYRLHPLIRLYLTPKIKKTYFYEAAQYYRQLLEAKKGDKNYFNIITDELISILNLINRLCSSEEWNLTSDLWHMIGSYLWHTGHFQELEKYAKHMYKQSIKFQDLKTQIYICVRDFCIYYYWSNKVKQSEYYAKRGLFLATSINDKYLVHLSKLRLGRVLLGQDQTEQSKRLIKEAYKYFSSVQDNEHMMNAHMYLGEIAIRSSDFSLAEKYFADAKIRANKLPITNSKSIFSAIISLYLGEIYYFKNAYVSARKYYDRGLILCKLGNENSGNIIRGYLGLGLLFEKKRDINKAKYYYDKTLISFMDNGISDIFNDQNTFYYRLQENIKQSKIFYPLLKK